MKTKVTTSRRVQYQVTSHPYCNWRDVLNRCLVGLSGSVSQGLQGDLVAECFELSDGTCLGFGGNTSREIVRPRFAIEFAVGEHMPGGDDHGVFDGYQGSHRTTSSGDAPVLRPKV